MEQGLLIKELAERLGVTEDTAINKRGGGDVDEFDHFRHGGTRLG